MARPPAERAAFVAAECAGDAALEQDVLALVANAASAEAFLEQPAARAASLPIVGRQLGAFAIEAQIGAGGMGEVYRAKDTRLGRTVAVKILPRDLAADPDRRQRFQREARAVAALNHPNICTIHDVGHADGVDFLVMELVEGESLATRLARGPLPLDQALARAIEIADALDKEHRQGIVHRDLKPGNVMLTKAKTGKSQEAQAKLLDFGLARVVRDDGALASVAPTNTSPLTEAGAVLGTLQYMAPEQIEGRPADARTDIFAFGALLYEMLTGQRAFDGASSPAVMANILRGDPPSPAALQPGLPSALDWLVRTCLAKDPEGRFASMQDVRLELQRAAARDTTAISEAAVSERRSAASWRLRAGWIVAAAAIVAIAVLILTRTPPARGTTPESRLVMPLGDDLQFPSPITAEIAVSPDGQSVAFSATRGTGAGQRSSGGGDLYVRPLDRLNAQPLGQTGSTPTFSPDGRWLAFHSDGKLQKMPLSGGAPIGLAESPWSMPAHWGAADLILVGDADDQAKYGIRRLSSNGGEPVAVTTLDKTAGHTHHLSPQLLPDGRTVLYTIRLNGGKLKLAVTPLAAGPPRVVLDDAGFGFYAGDGILLYQAGNSLFAARFDLTTLTVRGSVPVIENMLPSYMYAPWSFAGGTLAYRRQDDTRKTFLWVTRRGDSEPVGAPPMNYWNPRLSPRGDRIAMHCSSGTGTDVWTYDVGPGRLLPVTSDNVSRTPAWTTDGARLLIHRRTAVPDIFALRWDGTGTAEQVTHSGRAAGAAFTTSDDKTLVYHEIGAETGYDLMVKELGTASQARALVRTPSLEAGARLHPSGRWIAYATNVTGRSDVFVTAFPGSGVRIPVTVDGGREPVWSRDGRELFFRQGTRMLAVSVIPGDPIRFTAPKVLFDEPYFEAGGPGNTQYDVAPDGRFLMMKVFEQPLPHLIVIQNVTARLREALRDVR